MITDNNYTAVILSLLLALVLHKVVIHRTGAAKTTAATVDYRLVLSRAAFSATVEISNQISVVIRISRTVGKRTRSTV